MVEPIYITKSKVPLKSMDFAFLRKEAIEYLQKISPDTWTDHNTHDPGITIAEALAYVITDLGNRIGLPIEDIIASQPNLNTSKLEDIFPPAIDVLPNCAVTPIDFRKLLIDIDGVRNVYIKAAEEAEHALYYIDSSKALSYNTASVKLELNGLYVFQIEFDEHPSGDLNSNVIEGMISVTNGTDTLEFDLEIVFPYWDEIDEVWTSGETITAINLEDSIVAVAGDEFEDYYAEFMITFSNSEIITDFPIGIKTSPAVDPSMPGLDTAVIAALQSHLEGIMVGAPFQAFWERLQAIRLVQDQIELTFCNNRNLCEDLLRMEALRIQDIGLKGSIEVEAGVDPTKVISKIFFAIEQFFSPQITFHSLSDLQEESPLDQILEGPLLNNGFIKAEDFDILNKQSIIYTSDLVRLAMEIEGIVAVNNLTISNFINNIAIITDEPNCLRLSSSELYVPKLSIRKSQIEVTRNGSIVAVSDLLDDEIQTCLDEIRLENAVAPIVNDLSIPYNEGTELAVKDYWSIQYDFPKTYGIGKHRLSLISDKARLAKVKQLQAYLLLFDQILANHFSQLANVCSLFDLSNVNPLSYSFQTPYDIPGIQDLLADFNADTDDWDTFINDSTNSYAAALESNSSIPSETYRRKNQFLDHQLARVAHTFEDYEKVMQSISSYNFDDEIIADKTNYLKKFPAISKARGKGFNYKALTEDGTPDVWDTDNISGLEMSLCHRLGFRICERHDLYHPLSEFFELYDEVDSDAIIEWRFRLRHEEGHILLSSSMNYASTPEAWAEIEEVLMFIQRRDRYQIITAINGTFYFNLLNDDDDIIARRIQGFNTLAAIEAAIDEVINFTAKNYSGEGLFVLEHLLLRPKIKGVDSSSSDTLLTVPEINDFPLQDPYSFVISVVFPSGYQRDFSDATSVATPSIGGERFRDEEFRRLITRVLAEEAPASVFINEYYLDINTGVDLADTASLNNFQAKYKTWLETNADPASTDGAKLIAQQELVLVFNQIYFEHV